VSSDHPDSYQQAIGRLRGARARLLEYAGTLAKAQAFLSKWAQRSVTAAEVDLLAKSDLGDLARALPSAEALRGAYGSWAVAVKAVCRAWDGMSEAERATGKPPAEIRLDQAE